MTPAGETETLRLAYEEAHAVLDRYFAAITHVDARSTHMTLLSTTVLGVLLSAIVVLGTSQTTTVPNPRQAFESQALIVALIFGAMFNATSLILALTTDRRGGIAIGLESNALETVRARPPATHEFLAAAIGAYTEAIQSYYRVHAERNRQYARAKSAFLVGLVSVLAGIATFIIFQVGVSI